jgi:RNA polymerase sigma-70 factor (ECF subfamily)
MIEAIKRGDTFAYNQAYLQYRDKVYAYFLKKTKCQEDAKDLLQITFLKLWQYRRTLSENYLLEQHLFHIARTAFIDHIRKQNKLQKIQKSINEEKENTSRIYTSTAFDMEARLQSALSSMPALRKKVFELNRLQGYSYKEIAQLLSISLKSVDNNLTKALRQLRKIFMLITFIMIMILFL